MTGSINALRDALAGYSDDTRVVIVHHIDPDGYFGAHGLVMFMQENYPDVKVKLVRFNYGFDFPTFKPNDIVYLVDVSFPIPLMDEIARRVKLFTWIDHHKSAILDMVRFYEETEPSEIPISWQFTSSDFAGCENVYRYLNNSIFQIPFHTKLVGQYDNWDQNDFICIKMHLDNLEIEYDEEDIWNDVVVPYYTYMLSLVLSPDDIVTHLEKITNYSEAINIGKAIMKYRATQAKRQCGCAEHNEIFMNTKLNRFLNKVGLIKWAKKLGLVESSKCIALNTHDASKSTFYSISGYNDYVMMAFKLNLKGEKVSCSLRCDDTQFDASLIAKSYGGGGHKGAAGFAVNRLDDLILLKKIR